MAARAVNDARLRPYLATKQPIAGGPGSADDVAEAALYLCEPASRFVTGAELVVDGGWSRFGRPSGGRGSVRAGPIFMSDRPDVFSQYLAAVRAAIDAIEATSCRDPRGGRPIRGHDSQGPPGPRLRHGPFADGRRGDVPSLWLVSGLPPDRRAVDDLSQRGRGGQRPAPGDVSGKRSGLRPGSLAKLRDLAR